MSTLLQEAIADANRVKELAYENAKQAIEEAFQPRIQRMISSRLAEDDLETPDAGMEDDEFMMDEPAVPTAPEDEFMENVSYIDDGKKGVPASHRSVNEDSIEEEINSLIRELESDMAANVPPAEDELEPDGDEFGMGESVQGLDEKNGDGYDDDCGKGKKNTTAVAEVKRLRNAVARLTRENKDALRALSTMKAAMNEVNLLNAKLMFSSKVMQKFDLTESQQVKILETFDRAKSIREVQLIFTTINGNYQNQSRQRVTAPAKPARSVNESASRPIRTVKRAPMNEEYGFANRWKVLAGLRKIND